jgi:hypothetical protein
MMSLGGLKQFSDKLFKSMENGNNILGLERYGDDHIGPKIIT